MKKKQMGKIIRGLRNKKGITQEDLAEVLEVSTPAISKWETGQTNPDISMLPIIARYFNVTIDFLFGLHTKIEPVDIEVICRDVVGKFNNLEFKDAEKEWYKYLLQYPDNYLLIYRLATIGLFNMDKAKSVEEINLFARKLIKIFKKCINSHDMVIKQGSYFQIANLYVLLQDYDRASLALSKIPEQKVNTKFLASIIHINKEEFQEAKRNI